jgi:S1-C subfamily serine protease
VIKAKVGEPASQLASSDNSTQLHAFLSGARFAQTAQGVEITDIERGSTAASSGLRPGDIILSANRNVVTTIAELKKAVSQSDQRLMLRIKRGNAALYLVLQ